MPTDTLLKVANNTIQPFFGNNNNNMVSLKGVKVSILFSIVAAAVAADSPSFSNSKQELRSDADAVSKSSLPDIISVASKPSYGGGGTTSSSQQSIHQQAAQQSTTNSIIINSAIDSRTLQQQEGGMCTCSPQIFNIKISLIATNDPCSTNNLQLNEGIKASLCLYGPVEVGGLFPPAPPHFPTIKPTATDDPFRPPLPTPPPTTTNGNDDGMATEASSSSSSVSQGSNYPPIFPIRHLPPPGLVMVLMMISNVM
jgi:hypothetical protein